MLHVTEIIKLCGMIPEGPWYTPVAMQRGTMVHRATEDYDRGRLCVDNLAADVLERTLQYTRFVEEVRPEIIGIEERVTSSLGYCGTLDRRLKIGGREGVLDIKPSVAAWHG